MGDGTFECGMTEMLKGVIDIDAVHASIQNLDFALNGTDPSRSGLAGISQGVPPDAAAPSGGVKPVRSPH